MVHWEGQCTPYGVFRGAVTSMLLSLRTPSSNSISRHPAALEGLVPCPRRLRETKLPGSVNAQRLGDRIQGKKVRDADMVMGGNNCCRLAVSRGGGMLTPYSGDTGGGSAANCCSRALAPSQASAVGVPSVRLAANGIGIATCDPDAAEEIRQSLKPRATKQAPCWAGGEMLSLVSYGYIPLRHGEVWYHRGWRMESLAVASSSWSQTWSLRAVHWRSRLF
ncbi:hypothetical protein B0T11DRAFT_143032 [Plectosphaerella cucumerina]|uniref:Uncharacterized protein n=1 Tax=Plectosphaerella cucumerina TaxID=40658 RepID=A0A8K0WXZ0_9PEZI|nr:hypothetical protein B0T11DRAFT_143032 [Plectosphaerella cucumerina]